MKYPRLLFVAVTAMLALTGCKDEAKQEITDAFEAFNSAIDSKNGDAALAVIDEKYVEQFGRLLSAAQAASAEKIFRMRPSERSWIVTFRNRLTKEEMSKLDARSLCKLMIDRGWDLEDGEQESYSLGRISIRPPRATAEMLVDGDPTGLKYEFVEVDHAWKVDPTCVDEHFDRMIEKLSVKAGLREDTLILKLEGISSGQVVSPAIWNPPK